MQNISSIENSDRSFLRYFGLLIENLFSIYLRLSENFFNAVRHVKIIAYIQG